MSTLVMVEKAGVACMAADTLTSFGSRKQSARYAVRPEKILEVDGSTSGWLAGARTSPCSRALSRTDWCCP